MSELAKHLRSEFADKEYAHSYADEILNACIATQVKVIRDDQLGWSQRRLAQECGMKQERISVLENINYSSWSVNTLRRLAKAFDLRLRITFESFSTLVEDLNHLRKDALMRKTREQELKEFSEVAVSERTSEEIRKATSLSQDAIRENQSSALAAASKPATDIFGSSLVAALKQAEQQQPRIGA